MHNNFLYLKIIENYLQKHAQNLLTFLGPEATKEISLTSSHRGKTIWYSKRCSEGVFFE